MRLNREVSGSRLISASYGSFYSVAAGARTLASLLSTLSSRCPNAKFSLSGYSKGALVMHRTTLSSSIQPKVVAVAVFGVSFPCDILCSNPTSLLTTRHNASTWQDPQQSSGSRGIPINNVACFFQYWWVPTQRFDRRDS